jgi:type IV pilus assembly protein PilW
VVTQAYVSSIATQRSQTDQTRLNESARFAFDLIGKTIRKAGYRNTYALYPATATAFAQEFCATSTVGRQLFGANDTSSIDPAASDFSGSTVATLNNSDVLRTRYYGEDNIAGTATDNSVLDCQGNAVRRGTLVEDTLYIAADNSNNNEPTLYCNTTSSGSIALVPGVESMQILYGEDTDNDGIINRYIPASTVTATQWDRILSVRVGIVVRTPNPVSNDNSVKKFNLFGTSYAPGGTPPGGDSGSVFSSPNPGDRRVRLMYTTEFALRNYPQC